MAKLTPSEPETAQDGMPQAMTEIPIVRQLRGELDAIRDEHHRERRALLETLYPDGDSNLVAHARRELELAGLLDATSDYGGMLGREVLDLIRVFAGGGHSGFSAHSTIDIFARCARFDTLSPLTAHPSEWMEVGTGMWQSRRKPSAFWREGEATWYDLETVAMQAPTTRDPEAAR